MSKWCSFGLFLGRVCISVIFILAAVGKFMDYDGTAQYMASKGLTMIPFFLVGAALVELLGGLSLLFGYKTRFGATILLLFLIPTTVIFHNFWAVPADQQQAMLVEFLKNLAIFGGLLYVLTVGSGKCSVDSCCGGTCETNQKGVK